MFYILGLFLFIKLFARGFDYNNMKLVEPFLLSHVKFLHIINNFFLHKGVIIIIKFYDFTIYCNNHLKIFLEQHSMVSSLLVKLVIELGVT